jgi:hypothetical protein
MGTWNFSEFIIFFQKGWNSFKIYGRIKLDLVPNLYLEIQRELEVLPMNKVWK